MSEATKARPFRAPAPDDRPQPDNGNSLHALRLSVQRPEQAFGVLETDVNKRVVSRPVS
jgi:hypothetical protein